MPLLFRRLRPAKAELTIEAEYKAPPDLSSGGVVRVSVLLLPGESFTINRGWLELSLITTRFSRTVLDGYHEHSTEKLSRIVELCGNTEARPSAELEWTADVPLSLDRPSEGRPIRSQWKFLARFDVGGCREIRTARLLHDASSAYNSGPVVDGTGFLPL